LENEFDFAALARIIEQMKTERDHSYEFGKVLAESHLETAFDKYIVIGFSVDKGEDLLTNCDDEQFKLLLSLFLQNFKEKE
jgi:hypothetical protein